MQNKKKSGEREESGAQVSERSGAKQDAGAGSNNAPGREEEKNKIKGILKRISSLKNRRESVAELHSIRAKFNKSREKRKQPRGLGGLGHRKKRVAAFLQKAGVTLSHREITRGIFKLTVAINLILGVWIAAYLSREMGIPWTGTLLYVGILWVAAFVVILFALWLVFYLFVDLNIFRRRKTIEEVLPDYLELTSSNINAGMTVDSALWYAVRPRFGVLAREIEIVAKQTLSGMELTEALEEFAKKYDSPLLERTVNLIVEGIRAGGEIGPLLNKIAINIKESQILRKEMSANITNYAIFITFAAIVAAPLLLALSTTLLQIISSIMGSLTIPQNLNINFFSGKVGINTGDFKIFAVTNLLVTSLFSSIIVATIKKGEIKAGVRYIPAFIITALAIYYISVKILSALVGGLF